MNGLNTQRRSPKSNLSFVNPVANAMVRAKRSSSALHRLVACVLLTLLVLPMAFAAGPASELYLTAGDQRTILVVQGGSVLRSWGEVYSNESPLAVLGTVRTTGGGSGFSGHEYTLDGTYTGVTYVLPYLLGTQIYDGASDGEYIYAWDFNQNRVLRFDLNWNNPTPLFSIDGSGGDFLGITYDEVNNSLWISGWNKSEIRDYSMTGQLLSSFAVPHDHNAALALDPATQTLWLADWNALGNFEQYSKTGVQISSQFYPALGGWTVLGGEFQGSVALSLRCPTNMTVAFDNENGATVYFTPRTKSVSTNITVNCVPPSGSTFPIGTTTVVCKASDDLGNTDQCSFVVTVLGGADLKFQVLTEMMALQSLPRGNAAHVFNEAIASLTASLAANVWVDEFHLLPRGEKGFLTTKQRQFTRCRI